MKRHKLTILLFGMMLLLAACSAQGVTPTTIEVTRIVERIVEVTVVTEIEATRIVEGLPDTTEATDTLPSAGATETPTVLSATGTQGLAKNFLGEVTEADITVEFARVLCDARENIEDLEGDIWASHPYVCVFMWRLTNNSSDSIRWSDAQFVRVNGEQIGLMDWIFGQNSSFGALPREQLYPGSSSIGGAWVGVGELSPDEITSVSLIFGPAEDMDFNAVTGDFIIDAELPLPHTYEEFPNELR